jgi:hypothetical protein
MAGAPYGVGDLRVMMSCSIYCMIEQGKKYQQMRQRKGKRLRGVRRARAHRGDRNRAVKSADMADSDDQICAAWWRSDVIEGGRLERASRRFYWRSGLARGLGFRRNWTNEGDTVFGPVSCSRWKTTDRWGPPVSGCAARQHTDSVRGVSGLG